MSDEPERPRRESLGDRIERSIDARTDAVTEIARGEAESAARGPSIRRTAFWLLVTGVSLYLVAPSLIDVLGSWQNLSQIALLWFPLLALLQFASLACIWILQRLTIPRSPWSAVIDSQLAGNALAKIAPGGGAMGAALQYRMLVERGVERGRAVAGITAVNLLTFAVVLGLPVLALPALFGGSVDRGLLEAAIVSLIVFLVLTGIAALLLAADRPLDRVTAAIEKARDRARRSSPHTRNLPERGSGASGIASSPPSATTGRRPCSPPSGVGLRLRRRLASLAAVGAHPRPRPRAPGVLRRPRSSRRSR